MSPQYRVGQGTDRHRLETGESLLLGGVRVESERGTVGHSDGDVLVHALIDALLGAAGLGDIGQYFPDTDDEWSNADSLDLLERTLDTLGDNGWTPINLDATVRLESIKLSPYRKEIVAQLRETLPGSTTVNVKFTTGEGLGPVGREEAVEASAVCLLETRDN